jgi:hypothetical protein
MWEPRHLTSLWASLACCRDSFTFLPEAGSPYIHCSLPFHHSGCMCTDTLQHLKNIFTAAVCCEILKLYKLLYELQHVLQALMLPDIGFYMNCYIQAENICIFQLAVFMFDNQQTWLLHLVLNVSDQLIREIVCV